MNATETSLEMMLFRGVSFAQVMAMAAVQASRLPVGEDSDPESGLLTLPASVATIPVH